MSDYPNPPPSYQTGAPATKGPVATDEAAQPLLGGGPRAGPSAGNAFFDQPAADDLPDDFKVSCNSGL